MSDGLESHTAGCSCETCRATERFRDAQRIGQHLFFERVRVPDPNAPVRQPKLDTKHTLLGDARVVAAFIVGWWPALEDGIIFGAGAEAERPSRSSVWRAARRIMKNRYADG